MNRKLQTLGLGLVTFSMAGAVVAVAPQALTVSVPQSAVATDGSQVVSVANSPSDLVNAYQWRETASPPTTPPPPKNKQGL